jgi:hypothetical protein
MCVPGRCHPAAGISGKLPVFFQPASLPPSPIRLVSVENGKIHVKLSGSVAALSPAGAGGLRPPARPLPRGVQRSTCLFCARENSPAHRKGSHKQTESRLQKNTDTLPPRRDSYGYVRAFSLKNRSFLPDNLSLKKQPRSFPRPFREILSKKRQIREEYLSP